MGSSSGGDPPAQQPAQPLQPAERDDTQDDTAVRQALRDEFESGHGLQPERET
jgi:hypothetical protein